MSVAFDYSAPVNNFNYSASRNFKNASSSMPSGGHIDVCNDYQAHKVLSMPNAHPEFKKKPGSCSGYSGLKNASTFELIDNAPADPPRANIHYNQSHTNPFDDNRERYKPPTKVLLTPNYPEPNPNKTTLRLNPDYQYKRCKESKHILSHKIVPGSSYKESRAFDNLKSYGDPNELQNESAARWRRHNGNARFQYSAFHTQSSIERMHDKEDTANKTLTGKRVLATNQQTSSINKIVPLLGSKSSVGYKLTAPFAREGSTANCVRFVKNSGEKKYYGLGGLRRIPQESHVFAGDVERMQNKQEKMQATTTYFGRRNLAPSDGRPPPAVPYARDNSFPVVQETKKSLRSVPSNNRNSSEPPYALHNF